MIFSRKLLQVSKIVFIFAARLKNVIEKMTSRRLRVSRLLFLSPVRCALTPATLALWWLLAPSRAAKPLGVSFIV